LLGALVKVSPSVDSRLPITKILLLRLVQSLSVTELSSYQKYLLQAMFVISFYGLMRIGEITKDKLGGVAILLNQVKIYKEKVVITISKFKHNLSLQPFDIILHRQDQYKSVLSEYLVIIYEVLLRTPICFC
jgi:hypothetical protein